MTTPDEIMTDLNLTTYIPALVAVMNALGLTKTKLTYGQVATCIGMWDGQGRYPRAFNRLLDLTAETINDHSPEFWCCLVNAKTGKPGQGFYA